MCVHSGSVTSRLPALTILGSIPVSCCVCSCCLPRRYSRSGQGEVGTRAVDEKIPDRMGQARRGDRLARQAQGRPFPGPRRWTGGWEPENDKDHVWPAVSVQGRRRSYRPSHCRRLTRYGEGSHRSAVGYDAAVGRRRYAFGTILALTACDVQQALCDR